MRLQSADNTIIEFVVEPLGHVNIISPFINSNINTSKKEKTEGILKDVKMTNACDLYTAITAWLSNPFSLSLSLIKKD